MDHSLTTRLPSKSRLEFVGINKIRTLGLAGTKPAGVGVCGMGACTVLVIISKSGLIVANVGPDALPCHERSDLRSYIDLASDMFTYIEQDYREHISWFDEGTMVYLAYNTIDGAISCPEQLAVLRNGLGQIDLCTEEFPYETCHKDMIHANSPRGLLWIDLSNRTPRLFLEGREITSSPWMIVEDRGKPILFRSGEAGPREWQDFPRGVWVRYFDGQRKYRMSVHWDGESWSSRS